MKIPIIISIFGVSLFLSGFALLLESFGVASNDFTKGVFNGTSVMALIISTVVLIVIKENPNV